jgi:hypothetical protein
LKTNVHGSRSSLFYEALVDAGVLEREWSYPTLRDNDPLSWSVLVAAGAVREFQDIYWMLVTLLECIYDRLQSIRDARDY